MDLNRAADEYSQATSTFLEIATQLSDVQLDSSKSGGWTPRQIIHHVADSEAQSYARLRRLIAEPGTAIQGYDEASWGENETLGYRELSIDHSVSVFKAVRASSLMILKRLNSQQLSNFGVHSESGKYTVEDWLNTYIKHPLEHADQIRLSL